MGDVFRYQTRKQLETLDNIEMLRLLYLFEIVTYMQYLDETTTDEDVQTILNELPLITEEHYRFILENLTLPDDVLGKR